MPEHVYNERMRKANKNARKGGYQVSEEYKARAALNLFITSAPPEFIDIETAWKIYSLRWQIELTFKIWKSICKIDKVKKYAYPQYQTTSRPFLSGIAALI